MTFTVNCPEYGKLISYNFELIWHIPDFYQNGHLVYNLHVCNLFSSIYQLLWRTSCLGPYEYKFRYNNVRRWWRVESPLVFLQWISSFFENIRISVRFLILLYRVRCNPCLTPSSMKTSKHHATRLVVFSLSPLRWEITNKDSIFFVNVHVSLGSCSSIYRTEPLNFLRNSNGTVFAHCMAPFCLSM